MCVSVGEWERRVRGCVPQLTPTRRLSTHTSRPETRSTLARQQLTSGRQSDQLGPVDTSTSTVDARVSMVNIRASTIDQWYKALYHCYMIQLVYLPIIMCSNSKNDSNRSHFCNRSKRLLEIKPLFLGVAFCY